MADRTPPSFPSAPEAERVEWHAINDECDHGVLWAFEASYRVPGENFFRDQRIGWCLYCGWLAVETYPKRGDKRESKLDWFKPVGAQRWETNRVERCKRCGSLIATLDAAEQGRPCNCWRSPPQTSQDEEVGGTDA